MSPCRADYITTSFEATTISAHLSLRLSTSR
nr:MAG TPA: hypothetical protein [Caudoviricetes sp.]